LFELLRCRSALKVSLAMRAILAPDPLTAVERAAILKAPRPRRDLPLVAGEQDSRKRLPLAAQSRPEDRRWRPTYAVWEVTLRCDLACRHCGSRAGPARRDELTTAECLDLARQMADLGVKEVSLIGGEVYLREDWTEIIAELRRLGLVVSMVTGGRGITQERAEASARAGLQSVSVSLDGMETTHDRLRGKSGSFRAALRAMGVFRAAGVKVACNSQINSLSMPDLPDLLETIIEHGAHSWQLALTVAMGRAADEPDVLLQPYDLLECFPLLVQLKRRCDESGVKLWPGNNIGYFGPHETQLRGGMPRGHMASCGAGRSTLGIEADGAVKGCPSLPSEAWTGGNVREHTLRAIWERAEPLRYTRSRTVDDLWGYCRGCYYADVCRAGCTWTSFALFGKAGNNPYCHHRALEFERQGLRERIVKIEQAPGHPFDCGRFEIVVEPSGGLRAP
jgi:radical SAM protein with 4Fe4S-binding SPASM domain